MEFRLSIFYKNLPAREYKFLIGEPDFTYQSLHKLLVNNELHDFDPVKEVLYGNLSTVGFPWIGFLSVYTAPTK